MDFDYWDNADAKWREEFGISNIVINHGKTHTVATRDLEHVGGEKGVRVRVQFKYLSSPSGGWSEILNAESDTFTCKADGPNTVIVTVSVFKGLHPGSDWSASVLTITQRALPNSGPNP